METLTLDGGESNEHPEPTSASFLAGGGAMGQIIRAYDWTSTPLGNPTGWPQGLRTVVQILLNTGHPMYIWWGPGLTCIYNDAYSRSIGPEMHPASLGKPAQSVWAEIWGTIGPQIEQVMSGGGPTWHENQLVPITRNGRREDVYWTYSYSPIGDDFALHGVGGVLVVCTETTPTIISEKRSRAELERQKRLFEEAPGFIAILRGEGHVFEFANRAYERLSGGRAVLGLPVREAFPEIEGQGFFEHLDRVYQSGEPFTAAHVPIRLEESDGFRLRYIDYIYAPVTDDKGAVTGIFVEGHDVTDAYLAERALRQSEERFRSFAETSTDTLWIVNAETGQLEYLSPAYENTWGEPRDAAMSDIGHWAERLHPGDREAALSALSKLRAGERHSIEYRIVRPDGEVRYIHDSGFPIYEAGRIRRMAGVAQDLTGFRLAERRLADNERWTRTLLEGIPQMVWRAQADGAWTWASPQWTEYSGQLQAASLAAGWLACVHPDDRERVRAVWAGASEDGSFGAHYRIYNAASGGYRWTQTRATPVRDDRGEIVEWLGASTDVHEIRQLQERQQVLVAELQHRVRNMLTVVRSVFSRTAEASENQRQLVDHFTGRLDSLARTQVIVTRSPSGKVDLNSLIREELLSVAAGEGPCVSLDGPEVMLDPNAAEAIGMAIHGLTTNALKYGALRANGAGLRIDWRVHAEQGQTAKLELTWLETGVPAVPIAPVREGFGRELIEEALPYRLGAETCLEFRPGGVKCTISMPLDDDDERASALLER